MATITDERTADEVFAGLTTLQRTMLNTASYLGQLAEVEKLRVDPKTIVRVEQYAKTRAQHLEEMKDLIAKIRAHGRPGNNCEISARTYTEISVAYRNYNGE